jgi:hypothetical protein
MLSLAGKEAMMFVPLNLAVVNTGKFAHGVVDTI